MPSAFRTVLTLCLAFLAASVVQSAPLDLDALASPAGYQLAAKTAPGERVQVSGLDLDAENATLEMRRLRIFSPGARILVDRGGVESEIEIPDIAWFTGTIAGAPGSRAFLGVRPSGEIRGLVSKAGQHWLVGRSGGASLETAVNVRSVGEMAELTTPGGFDCETSKLTPPGSSADAASPLPLSALETGLVAQLKEKMLAKREATPTSSRLGGTPTYTARIAIETDSEFLDKFADNESQAAAYLGDLFTYVSGIYVDEIDTSLEIVHIQFWDVETNKDPWEEANPACGLLEFGRYWNDFNSGISRTIAHFFSGKNNNGGIAWVGVLCSGAFNFPASNLGCDLSPNNDNYGGGYGYTGGMDANFDLDNPNFIWDVYGWNHEVGHNFNSPHTHCYAGIGGSALPVDTCESIECGNTGCYCGPEALPCGSPGAGCGTIMSYCHLLSGGFSNLSPTFGQGHPWGVEPDRVPDRMSNHVISRAASNQGCLDYFTLGDIFADGFESGDTSAWSDSI